ncbi:MAG: caspase family protein [Spirochaetota bacterium]
MAKKVLLALIGILSIAQLGAQAGPRFALVIGNGAYVSLKTLENPGKDAKAIAAALQELGFSVVLKTDVDRKTMNQAIVAFREALAGNAQSEGVFYYAGHGVQSSKNANYLIPVDASIRSESDLDDEAVRAQKVLDSLDEARNRVNLVIFDACRDNPLPAAARSSGARGLAVLGSAPPETVVLYSTAAGQTASDGKAGSRNSPFAAALLKYLAEPGDITRSIKLVTGEVKATTPEKQTPFVYSNLSKDFSLNRRSGTASSPSPSVAAAPAVVPSMTITRAYGSLSVSAATAGALYLDGAKLGDLPAGAKANLTDIEVGEHLLELRYAEAGTETKAVTVTEGLAAAVAFIWKKAVSVAPKPAPAAAPSKKKYTIGDTGPAGGIVFYDKGSVSDGWRYLEAAPSDQSTGAEWWNGSYISIATGTAVGTGKANTAAIIAAQGSGGYAATLCKNLSLGGYSDWYLPSKDELNLMYTNLKQAGLGGFSGAWLWSSSQYNDRGAWVQDGSYGGQATARTAMVRSGLVGPLPINPFIHFLGVRGRSPRLLSRRPRGVWLQGFSYARDVQ